MLLFGRKYSASAYMPNKLGHLARLLDWSGLTAERLAMRHTLAPYVTAYRSPASRAKLIAALTGGAGVARKGGAFTMAAVGVNTRLLFCSHCHETMRAELGELYWRRTHQLPLTFVCPDHSTPLQMSDVDLNVRNPTYIAASNLNCPPSAPTVLHGFAGIDHAQLFKIATESDLLLQDDDVTSDRTGAIDEIVDLLAEKGYLGAAGKVEWHLLHPTILAQLKDVATIKPVLLEEREGFSVAAWLPRLRHRSILPGAELVILARMIAAAAPSRPSCFGAGPWECRNPLADHYGQFTIDRVSRRTVYGDGYRGLFECSCGYSYTRQTHADGSIGPPRFGAFGPLLAEGVARARREGRSLWQTATALGVQVVVLLNAMEKEGIPIHWSNLPQAYRDQAARRELVRKSEVAGKRPSRRRGGKTNL